MTKFIITNVNNEFHMCQTPGLQAKSGIKFNLAPGVCKEYNLHITILC